MDRIFFCRLNKHINLCFSILDKNLIWLTIPVLSFVFSSSSTPDTAKHATQFLNNCHNDSPCVTQRLLSRRQSGASSILSAAGARPAVRRKWPGRRRGRAKIREQRSIDHTHLRFAE